LAVVGIEGPAVVGALEVFSVELAAVERHAAMRTGVAQGEGLVLAVASDNEWNFEQRGLAELVAMDVIGRQSAIPETRQHERVGRLALGRVEFGHGVEIADCLILDC
jgi:hypothetical protein